MAWSRQVSEIRIFLRNNGFGFVIGDEDVAKKEPKTDDEKEE